MKVELHDLAVQMGAATLGALVSLRAVSGTTLWQKVFNIVAAFSIAALAGPALVEQMSIESVRIGAGIIFMTGATGLVVFDAIVEGIRKSDLAAWIAGFLPSRKGS